MSYSGCFLDFYYISLSSAGIAMAEGRDVLYLPVVSVARVSLSWRYFSGVVRVVFFSVDSLGRVKFCEKYESWGCREGISLLLPLCLCVCFLP